jgi:hypothetical protein
LAFWRPGPQGRTLERLGAVHLWRREARQKTGYFQDLFKQLGQEFAPGAKWLFAQIFSFEKQQIEDVIYQRYTYRAFEYLE